MIAGLLLLGVASLVFGFAHEFLLLDAAASPRAPPGR